MNSRYLPLWMVCLPVFLAACGGRNEIRAMDYDQSCTKNEECQTVLVGNPCECSCDSAAIRKSEVDEYTRDIDDIKADCAADVAKCAACPELKGAACTDGKCVVATGAVSQ